MKSVLKWLGIGLVMLVIIFNLILAIDSILPPGWVFGFDVLVTLTGAALSLGFMFIPKLRVEFAALSSEYKQLVNLILVVVLGAGMFLLTCTRIAIVPGIECTQAGLKTLLTYVFLAAGGNQVMYKLTPPPADVLTAKADRNPAG